MYFTYNVYLIQTIIIMKNLIYNFKHEIWKELKDSFILCIDIGEFNDDFFYGEDIPRVFYDNKIVLPDKIVKKAINSDKSSEIYRFLINCFVLCIGLKLSLIQKNCEILADAYCTLSFGSLDRNNTQFEQLYFIKLVENTLSGKDFILCTKENKRIIIQKIYLKIIEWQKNKKLFDLEINSLKKNIY